MRSEVQFLPSLRVHPEYVRRAVHTEGQITTWIPLILSVFSFNWEISPAKKLCYCNKKAKKTLKNSRKELNYFSNTSQT